MTFWLILKSWKSKLCSAMMIYWFWRNLASQIDPPPHFLKSLEPSTSRVNGTIHSVKRETYTRAGAATDWWALVAGVPRQEEPRAGHTVSADEWLESGAGSPVNINTIFSSTQTLAFITDFMIHNVVWSWTKPPHQLKIYFKRGLH